MKITICSSVFFARRSYELKEELEKQGHTVLIYPQKIKVTDKIVDVEQFYKMRKTNILPFLKEKKLAIDEHIKKIENSDAVLVLNFDKKGKRGYIGGNTFLEMAIAYYLKKKIFLWKNPENDLPYFEEVLPLNPIIINGDLSKIK